MGKANIWRYTEWIPWRRLLLDKIDRRNTNELTKMLDDASLPTIYYNEKIISCPKPVINSEKYASSYDLTKDIHNKNTD